MLRVLSDKGDRLLLVYFTYGATSTVTGSLPAILAPISDDITNPTPPGHHKHKLAWSTTSKDPGKLKPHHVATTPPTV